MLIAGIDRITIATKFNINPSYISRIGRDRWVKVYEEWLEHKKETTFVFGDTKAVLLINYPDANIGVSASN
jgi:hypothetical protein